MSRQFSRDYITEVELGNVAGRAEVTIIGHDETVPNGGPFGLSPTFGAGSYLFDQSAIDRNATPAVVGVASTDNTNDTGGGTGALTVRITGLDASGDAQPNDVTMTGTTAANTASTFSAVFNVRVLTTGGNNANTGVIHVGTGSFTSGVPAIRMLSMQIGHNTSLSAYYVVPLAKTLVIRQFMATMATSNKDVDVFVSTSTNGVLWFVEAPFGLEAGDFTTEIIALPKLVSGTHIKLTVRGAAAATDVTAALSGELIDD